MGKTTPCWSVWLPTCGAERSGDANVEGRAYETSAGVSSLNINTHRHQRGTAPEDGGNKVEYPNNGSTFHQNKLQGIKSAVVRNRREEYPTESGDQAELADDQGRFWSFRSRSLKWKLIGIENDKARGRINTAMSNGPHFLEAKPGGSDSWLLLDVISASLGRSWARFRVLV